MSSPQTIPAESQRLTDPTEEYQIRLAASAAEIHAVQRLRYEVFRRDFGATIRSESGVDVDEFDAYCDHLIVWHIPTDTAVGTYRLLPPGRTARLYSADEFELSALDRIRPDLVEAGRSCVHPEHRDGAVISLLWTELARYMARTGYRYLAGCASASLADGGTMASATWRMAEAKHRATEGFTVTPYRPWQPATALASHQRPSYGQLPPLVRGYLRLGAAVCGPPAYDPDFHVADFFVLLDMHRIPERYLRYFLGGAR
ncbi:putative hemolysin [Tamaricihabitans halophyticus]|uniref:Putative hemolysin n=1 Tax=Tamaricihabitans halophyticus TaxID=1262583 RepID=A0A4R2R0M2_9PSEU|nr:GNAT family N-acyltransferase [Tamaricihabitans halophyticus]TCP52965.1 putative hemolysin [Tamaricihabitans halophyticus]